MRSIDDVYANYLLQQLSVPNLVRVRLLLQEICKLYRQGQFFKPAHRHRIEVLVLGQLISHETDIKLCRWCLNVLALIGTSERSQETIERILNVSHNDPDTMAAAITAYFRVSKDAYSKLSKLNVASDQLVILSAIKGGYLKQVDIVDKRINIDKANPAVLRNALLGVGLNKLPENMFEPNYRNSTIIGKLSAHDNQLVSQYAVWAVAENPDLTASDLTIDIKNLDDYSKNVRGWVYRLYAQEHEYSHGRHELILRGSQEEFVEARRNLALGLLNEYYDGLEAVIMPWYAEEDEAQIQALLIDHMVKNSYKCSPYEYTVVQFFKEFQFGSAERERMQVMAFGTSLFKKFKQIAYEGDGDLFGQSTLNTEEGMIVTNNFNIGQIQGGAISMSGDASNSGNNINSFTGEQINYVKTLLDELTTELEKHDIDYEITTPIKVEIEAAKLNPDPQRLNKIISMINKTSDISKKILTLGGNAEKIIGIGSRLLDLINTSG